MRWVRLFCEVDTFSASFWFSPHSWSSGWAYATLQSIYSLKTPVSHIYLDKFWYAVGGIFNFTSGYVFCTLQWILKRSALLALTALSQAPQHFKLNSEDTDCQPKLGIYWFRRIVQNSQNKTIFWSNLAGFSGLQWHYLHYLPGSRCCQNNTSWAK